MKCCNQDCNQGRCCPVQRLKAGGPPPTEYPWQEPHPDDQMPLSDRASAAIVLAIIVLIWVLVALLVGVM
jgi:hypothetical protein